VSQATSKKQVGILGGGPWGVALAFAAARAGAEVTMHTRRDPPPNPAVRVTQDYAEIAKASLVLVAVPSTVVREVLRALGDHLDGHHLVVHGIRGLSTDSLETVSDIIRAETPARRCGALGGPVQATELLHGRPSAMVVGSRFPEVTAAVVEAFASPSLHVRGTPDIRGLEWASALVGCVAIGVGYAEASGAGPGLLAALISTGVDECAKLLAMAGAEDRTMLGLGGYGDLLASIALDHRPEVIIGKAIAKGRSLEEAVTDAKLRVEAITLIPRIVAFAHRPHLLHHPAALRGQRLPRVGEHHAARRPLQQRDARSRLERVDLPAERRARHPQRIGGREVGALLRDRDERPKLLQIHAAPRERRAAYQAPVRAHTPRAHTSRAARTAASRAEPARTPPHRTCR
jgi:glycerol-3-phosphate dehydrogenase (NAD(P)+)